MKVLILTHDSCCGGGVLEDARRGDDQGGPGVGVLHGMPPFEVAACARGSWPGGLLPIVGTVVAGVADTDALGLDADHVVAAGGVALRLLDAGGGSAAGAAAAVTAARGVPAGHVSEVDPSGDDDFTGLPGVALPVALLTNAPAVASGVLAGAAGLLADDGVACDDVVDRSARVPLRTAGGGAGDGFPAGAEPARLSPPVTVMSRAWVPTWARPQVGCPEDG